MIFMVANFLLENFMLKKQFMGYIIIKISTGYCSTRNLADPYGPDITRILSSHFTDIGIGEITLLDQYQSNICDEAWWRHELETFSASLALCDGILPAIDGFPSQRASNASFDVFFAVRLNKWLNKLSFYRWL